MNLMLRLIPALIIALVISYEVLSCQDADAGIEDDSKKPRYRTFLSGMLLPYLLLIFLVLNLLLLGTETTADRMLTMCFHIFMVISVYDLLLIPMLPLLRKIISARACALLWMLPNLLYFPLLYDIMPDHPVIVLSLSGRWIFWVCAVWLAGFVAVMAFEIRNHLRFRRQILKDAAPVEAEAILQVWRRELENTRIQKPKMKLVRSPAVTTPLTIGLFSRAVRVVLPEKDYTAEELVLIFRHELIHICRGDPWNKFFLIFCCAACWFHPLMWIAARKCTEDLELSCDETVLLEADDAQRKQYAGLILRTAGDDRGFSTCLSASAKALRHRLKGIVCPRPRHSGAILIGVLFVVLFLCVGQVSLAYDEFYGAEVIFSNSDPALCTMNRAESAGDGPSNLLYCTDENALLQYLANLSLQKMTGDYDYSNTDRVITLQVQTPRQLIVMELTDHHLRMFPLGTRGQVQGYYIPAGADWAFLDSVLLPDPKLTVTLQSDGQDVHSFEATLTELSEEQTPILKRDGDSSGCWGYGADEAVLSFDPAPLSWTLETVPEIKDSAGKRAELIIPLSEKETAYIICARIPQADGVMLDAVFSFTYDPGS